MNNSTLKQLLLEYSRKRNKEIADANIKKEKIYQENPRLQEIDDELSKFSIQTAKSILQTNDRSLLDTLKSKKEYLLNEKNEIYNSLNIDSTYFYPQFECNLCKDTGYITENYTTKMCNCLKQKIFDAEYNKIPTIPLVDEWEICGIKEHGGLNAWEWVRANLVIRNLPLFIEKEIEIPNNNNGVTDVQTSFNIIWEYIGKDKIPSPVTSIEELQATIEQLQSENQKLKENLSIYNGKFEKILAIINDQRNINI